jgi:hypothetical protein
MKAAADGKRRAPVVVEAKDEVRIQVSGRRAARRQSRSRRSPRGDDPPRVTQRDRARTEPLEVCGAQLPRIRLQILTT